eukprot:350848-Chlamydomonas_euryale.AAC.13
MLSWIANTRSRGEITQIIFGFPKEAYRQLLSTVPQSWYSERTLFKLTNGIFERPGTVMELTDKIPEIATVLSTPDEQVTSRAGNVHGYTGYYLYLARFTNWRIGQVVYVPSLVVDMMPRVAGEQDCIEYTFYGSEDYCYLQKVCGLPPPR